MESGSVDRAAEGTLKMKVYEALEGEQRNNNLIIMGLPEASEEDDDSGIIKKIISKLMQEVNIDLVVVRRIGVRGTRAILL